jgi:2-polyprenyl-3-methyl-5-hydroxy-6-metoxy-1,4-benzoquinol methylase
MLNVEHTYTKTQSIAEISQGLERSDWILRESCPACGSKSIASFAEVRHIDYARCRECEFVFANPVPSDRSIGEFYNSDFYQNYRRLEEDNIAKNPYFSISCYTDPRRLAGWLDCDKSARILDFGCGPASFIALLRDEFGYQNVEGLELNKDSAAIAERQYNIKLTPTVDELKYQKYDVIILFEVIEHIPDPAEIIALCCSRLAENGKLFITTPSIRNIPGRFFPSHCAHYTAPSHVSLFTEEAMRRLLRRFDLGIERLETDDAPLLGNALVSPLYNLDVVSPRSADEFNDNMFVPNAFGKALGLAPSRHVGLLPFRAARRMENMISTYFRGRYSDHLYLLASRTA